MSAEKKAWELLKRIGYNNSSISVSELWITISLQQLFEVEKIAFAKYHCELMRQTILENYEGNPLLFTENLEAFLNDYDLSNIK